MSIGGFVIGLFLVAGSLLTLKYNRAVSGMLGTPSFLYRYFGPGREYTFYILLSFVVMFIGFFVMFGLFGMIADLFLSPFRGLIRE